jgi:hypothetical protein
MEQTLTDNEIRALYEKKQELTFSREKQILGAVYAVIILAVCFAAAIGLWAVVMSNITRP